MIVFHALDFRDAFTMIKAKSLKAVCLIVPKSETRGFDSWLTSSLSIKMQFSFSNLDVQMMSETKFYSLSTNEQNQLYGVIRKV